MNRPDQQPSIPIPSALIVGLIVAAGWIGLSAVHNDGLLSTCFVTSDIAAIYVLCSLPLASRLVNRGRQSLFGQSVNVIALLAIATFLFPMESPSLNEPTWFRVIQPGMARFLASLGIAIASTWTVNNLRPDDPFSRSFSVLASSLLLAALVPTIYVQASWQHDLATFRDLLAQSRLTEAFSRLQRMQRLAPEALQDSVPLRRIAMNLDGHIKALQAQVAVTLPANCEPNMALLRARQLAMLDRTDEALHIADSLRNTSVSPAANDLTGTICETRTQWQMARTYHRQSREEWLRQPQSVERTAGIIRASTRLGYCERKLGHYQQAETEYLQALALSPTADMHFLLAQFYDDMQNSTKAMSHARQAMRLNPKQFQREGLALIDKLTISHFGCLGVYGSASESARN